MPDATRESLRVGLEAVRAETLAQLQTILTPEQMEALAGKLEDLRDKALEALPEAA